MNRKRILRSWWLWAIVILFAFLVLPSLLSSSSDYHSSPGDCNRPCFVCRCLNGRAKDRR